MSARRLHVNLSTASIGWGPVPHGVTLESIEAPSVGTKPLFESIDSRVGVIAARGGVPL